MPGPWTTLAEPWLSQYNTALLKGRLGAGLVMMDAGNASLRVAQAVDAHTSIPEWLLPQDMPAETEGWRPEGINKTCWYT